jgi:hypothetical protein
VPAASPCYKYSAGGQSQFAAFPLGHGKVQKVNLSHLAMVSTGGQSHVAALDLAVVKSTRSPQLATVSLGYGRVQEEKLG